MTLEPVDKTKYNQVLKKVRKIILRDDPDSLDSHVGMFTLDVEQVLKALNFDSPHMKWILKYDTGIKRFELVSLFSNKWIVWGKGCLMCQSLDTVTQLKNALV